MGSKNPTHKAQNDSRLYFDMTTQERDTTLRYLLESIIKSRKSEGFPSNQMVVDEDVNIYLAHLLFAVSLPEYHEMANPYLSAESSDVLDWVRSTEDRTIRYFIFKVNADHLLIHSTIFNDIEYKGKNRFYQRSQNYYRELAKLYYEQAAAYHKRIYRKSTGIGQVLDKIARFYEPYQTVLKHVRRDYFHFVNSFRDQSFRMFLDQVKNYERSLQADKMMDHFLEIYWKWMNTPNQSLKQDLILMAQQLKALIPGFRFEPVLFLNKNDSHPGG
ncbi:MAG: hypothetical protein H6757_02165 [Candidatus Omnitrophica bacterium]|nr:hypothetical protein [Candidatus Omnitrophota bacterium]